MGLPDRPKKCVMNQVTTTCPHCTTVFRVNPEQLARREGLVKCGRCGAVFNGYETVAGSAMSPVLADQLPTTLKPRNKKHRYLTWGFGIGGLFVLLLITLFIGRNVLVRAWPELHDGFAGLLDPLGLRVELPTKLDLWVIESSDMREEPSDTSEVWLLATLRNRASFEQAYPWLDLALLDGEGTPLEVRRIPPKEYFGKKMDPYSGLGPNLEINIKLKLKRGQMKESGYRLVLFYPH